MHPTLSIIIVNYNVRYFLEQCLLSLQCATKNLSTEIIVIDNNSTDSDYKWLIVQFPQIIWHPLSENLGFSKANNIGIRMAKGDFILLLNPDTIIPENALTHALDFIKKNNDCGALGAHMIDGTGHFLPESKRSIPTPINSFYKLTGIAAIFPKSSIFGRYALTNLPADKIHSVPILAGAFMMIRRVLGEKIGGFDEQFFMYGEDIDLSYRLQKDTGYNNYFLGDLPILHFKGESSKQNIQKHYKIFYEAMQIFVRKYYKGFGSWFMRKSLDIAMWLQLHTKAIIQENISIPKTLKIFSCIGDQKSQEKLIQSVAIQYPNASYRPQPSQNQQDIIICIGDDFSYQQAIQYLLDHNNLSYNYYWFHPNAAAIIGSNDKEHIGIVWPI